MSILASVAATEEVKRLIALTTDAFAALSTSQKILSSRLADAHRPLQFDQRQAFLAVWNQDVDFNKLHDSFASDSAAVAKFLATYSDPTPAADDSELARAHREKSLRSGLGEDWGIGELAAQSQY